ncbi:Fe2+-enterobactin ABC transporter substrate-binding protein [Mycetocola spongiae]|uniref:Fe2+-enterobactin ABC transporter substrate-binding protein n=1 Tax=Mycetocola spongiae TaxID=2859226 RepID=UPI001CF1452F|nr:Fe2+-enterobactin ABC transporter substrate-binding protein [Mycetocola spongiae]UCR89898.1 Fe2+-enterobactin ABC transporter substrate-binding protein [Mycetocola spongiae]
MTSVTRRLLAAATVGLLALAATGCTSAAAPTETDSPAAEAGAWPRTVTHELGETTIPSQPKKIVSTSLTITGTLLAIDAPVIASAATTPGDGSDERGFFDQWSAVATERGLDVLYPDLEVDIESIIAADPDLIVVSTSGADSAAANYKELQDIAPTVVYNYGDKTWEALAAQLGEATGLEENAATVAADFDARVREVAGEITVPAGDTNVIVYNGPEYDTAFAKPGGSHGTLLNALGFRVAGAPDEFDTSERARQDFAFLSLENTTAALTGSTVFIVSGTEENKKLLQDTSVLANAPAVASGAIYPLGNSSFRIDYYSGSQIVDQVESLFAS